MSIECRSSHRTKNKERYMHSAFLLDRCSTSGETGQRDIHAQNRYSKVMVLAQGVPVSGVLQLQADYAFERWIPVCGETNKNSTTKQ